MDRLDKIKTRLRHGFPHGTPLGKASASRRKDLEWTVGEIERLQAMMMPLVFCNPADLESREWGEAMDTIGYYVTDELGVTGDNWRKRKAAEEARDGR